MDGRVSPEDAFTADTAGRSLPSEGVKPPLSAGCPRNCTEFQDIHVLCHRSDPNWFRNICWANRSESDEAPQRRFSAGVIRTLGCDKWSQNRLVLFKNWLNKHKNPIKTSWHISFPHSRKRLQPFFVKLKHLTAKVKQNLKPKSCDNLLLSSLFWNYQSKKVIRAMNRCSIVHLLSCELWENMVSLVLLFQPLYQRGL